MAILREIIDNSKYAVFFGGAGVSTASNIPDFRGKNGIYNTENEWGLPPEIIISHTFFTRRTKDFYDYYKKYMVYPSAVPNAVHIALARLEKEGKIKAVLTQNIDGLHQAAGSKNVYELHGSVHRSYCTRCGKFYDLDYILGAKGVPTCECGGVIKPTSFCMRSRLTTTYGRARGKKCDAPIRLSWAEAALRFIPRRGLSICFTERTFA